MNFKFLDSVETLLSSSWVSFQRPQNGWLVYLKFHHFSRVMKWPKGRATTIRNKISFTALGGAKRGDDAEAKATLRMSSAEK